MSASDLHASALKKLSESRISLTIDDYDRRLLAKNTGAVFVCNQLLPGFDEWILVALLSEHFEAVRILHPYPTPPARSLKPLTLRPQRDKIQDRLLRLNFAKRIVRHVQRDTAIGLPLDFSDNLLGNLGKNLLRAQILKQLRKAGQPVVPIHLETDRPLGVWRKAITGVPYLPGSKTLRVSVRIGQAISPEEIGLFKKTRSWGKFLQAKIFSLGSPFDILPEHFTDAPSDDNLQALAPATDPALIAAEIAQLPPTARVTSRGSFEVYVCSSHELPHTMLEIGRLRELTFRTAGEGTGKPRDLDEYDLYYLQLIIWDNAENRIVGGYRLGLGDLIFKKYGVNGFYTFSLFKMQPGFFPILQQAVELGRSYVVPHYQKHRLPLFLLWKGILHFLLANPTYRYLYGPVSISKYYSETSKGVIVEFVRRYFFDTQLAQLVQPRKPFRLKNRTIDAKLLAENLGGEFEALENFVENIEPSHYKVPVLFRQYLKQNARFIAFNVDPLFSDCLDGLMILDIHNVPSSTLDALKQEK